MRRMLMAAAAVSLAVSGYSFVGVANAAPSDVTVDAYGCSSVTVSNSGTSVETVDLQSSRVIDGSGFDGSGSVAAGSSAAIEFFDPITSNGVSIRVLVDDVLIGQDTVDCGTAPEPTDTDGDGVPDKDDAFPNDPNESKDTDKDGVGDNADQCDNEAGPASNNGCPVVTPPTDTDGDGVPDKDDAFPNDKDESKDTDGDGFGDNADQCDNEAGPASNNGCPVVAPPTDTVNPKGSLDERCVTTSDNKLTDMTEVVLSMDNSGSSVAVPYKLVVNIDGKVSIERFVLKADEKTNRYPGFTPENGAIVKLVLSARSGTGDKFVTLDRLTFKTATCAVTEPKPSTPVKPSKPSTGHNPSPTTPAVASPTPVKVTVTKTPVEPTVVHTDGGPPQSSNPMQTVAYITAVLGLGLLGLSMLVPSAKRED